MESKTVYSTEHATLCAKCSLAIARCECGRTKSVSKCNGNVRVGRQTKGRKGNEVTLITGLMLVNELKGRGYSARLSGG